MLKKNDEFIQNLYKIIDNINLSFLYKGYISTTNDKFEFIDFRLIDNKLNLITNNINTSIYKNNEESDFLVITKTNEYVIIIQYDKTINELILYDQLGENITTINNISYPFYIIDKYDSVLNEYNINIYDIDNKFLFSIKLDYDNSLINIFRNDIKLLNNNSSYYLFHINKQHDSIINDYIPYHSKLNILKKNSSFNNNKLLINSTDDYYEILIKNTEVIIGGFNTTNFSIYFSDKLDLLIICFLNKKGDIEISNYSNREKEIIQSLIYTINDNDTNDTNDTNNDNDTNNLIIQNIDLLIDLHSIYIFNKTSNDSPKRELLKILNTSNYKLPDYTILQEVDKITRELKAGIIDKVKVEGNNIESKLNNNTLFIKSTPKIDLLSDVHINNINDDILIKDNNRWESKDSILHIDESIKKILNSGNNLSIDRNIKQNIISLNEDININSLKVDYCEVNNIFTAPTIIKPENYEKININNKNSLVIFDPSNNRTGITINLPNNDIKDGQKIEIISRRNITNIQINPVNIVSNQILNLIPNTKITFIYSKEENMWYTVK